MKHFKDLNFFLNLQFIKLYIFNSVIMISIFDDIPSQYKLLNDNLIKQLKRKLNINKQSDRNESRMMKNKTNNSYENKFNINNSNFNNITRYSGEKKKKYIYIYIYIYIYKAHMKNLSM